MKETLKLVLTLTIICVVSAGALSVVYNITAPLIQQNQLGELRDTIKQAIPEAVSFDEPGVPVQLLEQKEGVKRIFKGLDDDKDHVGTAVIVEGPGYQDFISLLVALSPDLEEIRSVVILEQSETPGLGSRIEEEGFIGQFDGEIKEDYDSITGATVSSTTVIRLVKKAVDDLRNIEGEEDLDAEEQPDEAINESKADAETEASPEYEGTTGATPGMNKTEEENGTESAVE